MDYAVQFGALWQEHGHGLSLVDSDSGILADHIRRTCRGGKVLDVGCGTGGLVRRLLGHFVDTIGVDVAGAPVAAGNEHIPGRLQVQSLLDLSFSDAEFDTVVSINMLECLQEEDIPAALAECYRVCRQNFFLRIAVGPAERVWRNIVKPRAWWEHRLFEAGFRKHPHYYALNEYTQLEDDGEDITILFEKIPAEEFSAFPMSWLKKERDLHMDMMRETGRRSDAHIHRYLVARGLVRPGDVVVDAACGMGYGSHLIAQTSPVGSVLGLDLSEAAVGYAQRNFGKSLTVDFRQADVQDLSFIADDSVDLFVSFETLEHIPDPEGFLDEVARVLKPGGRFIGSVPNYWADETGEDPSPWHLHVYDWPKLKEQVAKRFILEKAFGETAGGGMRLGSSPRDFFSFDPDGVPPRDSEWLLIQAMRNPLEGRGKSYVEQMYSLETAPANLIAFARDYENPYLVHAMVSIPWRLSHPKALFNLAAQVVETSSPTSADYAAAVNVLAYRLLGDPDATAAAVEAHIKRLNEIVERDPTSAHLVRWRISGSFVAALLASKVGDLTRAADMFEQCANSDCCDFSPTLATKTILAAFHAGFIRFHQGRPDAAERLFQRGIAIYHDIRVLPDDRWLGSGRVPFDFPFYDMQEVVVATTNCVNALRAINKGKSPAAIPAENLHATISRLRQSLNDATQKVSQQQLLLSKLGVSENALP